MLYSGVKGNSCLMRSASQHQLVVTRVQILYQYWTQIFFQKKLLHSLHNHFIVSSYVALVHESTMRLSDIFLTCWSCFRMIRKQTSNIIYVCTNVSARRRFFGLFFFLFFFCQHFFSFENLSLVTFLIFVDFWYLLSTLIL